MRGSILALVFVAMIGVLPNPSLAVCFEPTLERAFSKSAMVFSGIAVRSEIIERGADSQFPSGADVWTFRVGQVWKGTPVAEVVIVDPHDTFYYKFDEGVHYVVYARAQFSSETLYTSQCTRTTKAVWAIPERHSLGKPIVVDEELRLAPISDAELENFDGYDGRYIDASPDPK